MDAKLVDKIQKLLSLATSANENESKLAAEKANELMLKHNIHLSQLEAISDEEYENREVFESKSMPYEANWAMQICQSHFFVKPVFRASRKRVWAGVKDGRSTWTSNPARIWFVGEKTNVQVAQYVFDFLRNKYKQLWKEYQAKTNCPHSSKGSYYSGLTRGLDYQLSSKRRSVEEEFALTIVEDPKLKGVVDQHHGKLRESSTNTHGYDPYAAIDGKKDGKNIKIQKGIETRAGNKGLALAHKK